MRAKRFGVLMKGGILRVLDLTSDEQQVTHGPGGVEDPSGFSDRRQADEYIRTLEESLAADDSVVEPEPEPEPEPVVEPELEPESETEIETEIETDQSESQGIEQPATESTTEPTTDEDQSGEQTEEEPAQ